VRLRDLLDLAGVKPSAVYVGHESPDVTPTGAAALSRGLPLSKAMADETLVAFRANGEPLPPVHGGPARIVAPGYPGSAWQKWLRRVWVRDREHDGARMTGLDYRLPRRPIAPGDAVDPSIFDVITSMPPRALVTTHADGDRIPAGGAVALGGWAWGHGRRIRRVSVSLDDGRVFSDAELGEAPDTPFGWRRFAFVLQAPADAGTTTAIIRAETDDGDMQPLREAAWNPKGYCNNACQRLSLLRI
jgi:sulfite oxidase